MPRTITTTQTTFHRPGTVTYDLYSSPPSSSSPPTIPNPLHATTITLPPRSTWTSGLHWHETHTEYLQVIQGAARVTLNGETAVYRAGDGVIVVVPRWARHEWRRADGGGEGEEEDVIVREWTDPVDGEKEVFFRNLNGVILDAAAAAPATGGWPVFESLLAWLPLPLPLSSVVKEFWLTWQLFVIFAGLDNYPVVYSGPGGRGGRWSVRVLTENVEWMVTHVLLLLATWVGGVLGLRAVYEEYTPRDLWVEYGVRRGLGGGKERVD